MSKRVVDRIQLGPQVGPDTRLGVRDRNGRFSPTGLRRVRGGESVDGAEVIHLSEADAEGWHEVTTLYDGRATEGGPAQVATPAYREGYDRIFGKKPTVGLA